MANGFERLERLGRVAQVFEVAVKDAGPLARLQHPQRFGGVAAERLRAEHGLAGRCGGEHGLLVQMIRQCDDDDVGLGIADRVLEIGRVLWDAPFGGKFHRRGRPSANRPLDAIAAAMAVEGHRVEHADQAGAEHGNAMHDESLEDERQPLAGSLYEKR